MRAWMAWPNSWASTTATIDGPNSLGEVVEDAVLAVVVDHEVAVGAVEGAVVADLLVGRRAGRTRTRGSASVRSG